MRLLKQNGDSKHCFWKAGRFSNRLSVRNIKTKAGGRVRHFVPLRTATEIFDG